MARSLPASPGGSPQESKAPLAGCKGTSGGFGDDSPGDFCVSGGLALRRELSRKAACVTCRSEPARTSPSAWRPCPAAGLAPPAGGCEGPLLPAPPARGHLGAPWGPAPGSWGCAHAAESCSRPRSQLPCPPPTASLSISRRAPGPGRGAPCGGPH